jgi:hypothetical protein
VIKIIPAAPWKFKGIGRRPLGKAKLKDKEVFLNQRTKEDAK